MKGVGDVIENVGIRQVVAEAGVTYREIAKRIGLTPQYLSRVMRYPLKADMQLRIMRAVRDLQGDKAAPGVVR